MRIVRARRLIQSNNADLLQRTRAVETAWFLHCAGLVDESTEVLKCRPKL